MAYMDEYRKWLEMFADDEATVKELEDIKDNAAEIEDRFYRELEFGTAGMRGVIGMGLNRMNIHNVRRVTAALAKFVKGVAGGAERGVVVGYDSRIMSDEFARQTALTLAAFGVKAYLFKSLRPVPVLSFSVRHLKAIAGVEITASHNPSIYNGYKVYWEDGGQLPPPRAAEVTAQMAVTTFEEAKPITEEEALAKGLLVYPGPEVDDAYIAEVKTLQVNPELAREMGKTLKIVYTPLNGTGNIPVRRILKEIGMENVYVVPEQELPDGRFPTVKVPNPEDKGAFELAIKMQKELGADLCVGTDPDCDRVGIACLIDVLKYSEAEIERIGRIGFETARKRSKKLCSVEKSNVLDSSRLWKKVMHRLADEYPDVELSDMLVDNCAMQIVKNPAQFDVIVTENMFGDILSDEASMITGSIGMIPSSSLGCTSCGLYEPIHGSAPDIAGQDKANPIGTILSAAMMLRFSFDMAEEATAIEEAVSAYLDEGWRTADIMSDGGKLVGCSQCGELIIRNLRKR